MRPLERRASGRGKLAVRGKKNTTRSYPERM
jgi:hypothetical protein